MIACVRPKLNLGGGGNSKIRYVTQGGGQNRNVTIRYIGGRGVKNDQNLRYVIFGRPHTYTSQTIANPSKKNKNDAYISAYSHKYTLYSLLPFSQSSALFWFTVSTSLFPNKAAGINHTEFHSFINTLYSLGSREAVLCEYLRRKKTGY